MQVITQLNGASGLTSKGIKQMPKSNPKDIKISALQMVDRLNQINARMLGIDSTHTNMTDHERLKYAGEKIREVLNELKATIDLAGK